MRLRGANRAHSAPLELVPQPPNPWQHRAVCHRGRTRGIHRREDVTVLRDELEPDRQRAVAELRHPLVVFRHKAALQTLQGGCQGERAGRASHGGTDLSQEPAVRSRAEWTTLPVQQVAG